LVNQSQISKLSCLNVDSILAFTINQAKLLEKAHESSYEEVRKTSPLKSSRSENPKHLNPNSM